MNHGSIFTRETINVWIRVKAKRKRIAVTRIDIELLLNNELKKNVKPNTAARYIAAKSRE